VVKQWLTEGGAPPKKADRERRSTGSGSCLQGSVAETARRWRTSRNVILKWVQRYHEDGTAGLGDRSRRPHRCPAQTEAQIEAVVLEAKKVTSYGRKRLAWYLWREHGVALSPHTIRHILHRNGVTGRKKKRNTFYPAQVLRKLGFGLRQGSPFLPLVLACGRCRLGPQGGDNLLAHNRDALMSIRTRVLT
jgi:transposase